MAEEYSIAPNFNNVAGLVVVTAIVVSGKAFAPVQGVGTYDPGEEQTYLDGLKDDEGEPTFGWLSTWMTWAQYEYLIATPLQGRRSNRVTVRTRFQGATYLNRNAILTLPKTATLTRTFGFYRDVVWTFLDKGAAS